MQTGLVAQAVVAPPMHLQQQCEEKERLDKGQRDKNHGALFWLLKLDQNVRMPRMAIEVDPHRVRGRDGQ